MAGPHRSDRKLLALGRDGAGPSRWEAWLPAPEGAEYAAGEGKVGLTAGAEHELRGIYRCRLAQPGAGADDGVKALLDNRAAAIESLPNSRNVPCLRS
jgi:hypothetical protein